MIAQSMIKEDHLVDLKKIFERLRKFDLKLNPNKCVFGVTSGKLLGVVVSQRGATIKAITEMPTPKTQKQVRGFLRCINYIGRFIPN